MASSKVLVGVSLERISEELLKGFAQARNPADYFLGLEETGLLYGLVPEFRGGRQVLHGTVGSHYGEDVVTHTCDVLGRAKRLSPRFLLTVALHDVGKVSTRTEEDGRIHFLGHEDAGAKIASTRLFELRFANDTVSYARTLIANHMRLNAMTWTSEKTMTKNLARMFVDFHENVVLLRDQIALSEADLNKDESSVMSKLHEFASTPKVVDGHVVMEAFPTWLSECPAKIGKLVNQMRYIQLTQRLSEEMLLKVMRGEASNVH